ncbi:hypothetical protein K435DRAFT_434362 [Dendrothele bispora CBS 962.96]|uniref:Uncharacterized protein n=1 Tax=Dendrothele bispora (strain CBS 962.96) TaxID=1314807 RepID=A0A4S8MDW0_DENBC|nr:hypothetical protein K435DRAFT_434362 [Dendrothele bispora CBS 962.96]
MLACILSVTSRVSSSPLLSISVDTLAFSLLIPILYHSLYHALKSRIWATLCYAMSSLIQSFPHLFGFVSVHVILEINLFQISIFNSIRSVCLFTRKNLPSVLDFNH